MVWDGDIVGERTNKAPTVCIAVATHIPYRMPKDDLYLPLHVGKAMHPEQDFGFVGDDTGDNISIKNSHYSELTGLYWMWKNVDADFIGYVQYRRHFLWQKKPGSDPFESVLTKEEAQALCMKNDIVLPRRREYYIQDLAEHLLHGAFAQPGDIDLFRSAVEEVSPEYLPAFDLVMGRKWGHMCNMFIMSRELLDDYCAWLFAVMDNLDSKLDQSRTRVLGYFAEHMVDIWIEKNGLDYVEIDALYLDMDNEFRRRVGFLLRLFGFKEASDKFVKRQR